MAQHTVELPNKLHAMMIRVCKHKNLTPSQLLERAINREIKAESPVAKLIIKQARKLSTKEGS